MSLFGLFCITEVDSARRSIGLDVVRCLAIALVVVGHGAALLPPSVNPALVFHFGGFFGVELFFVLSGYLIGSILLKIGKVDELTTFKILFGFWARRWFRTLPNYFLFLLLNATLFAAVFQGEVEFDPRYLLFLQNLYAPIPKLMPESWSLAIEEWFYLLLPIVLWAAERLPLSKNKSRLAGILAFIGFFTVLRFIGAYHSNLGWGEGIRKIVIFRLDSIGYGVLAAYCATVWPEAVKRYRMSAAIIGCALVALSAWSIIRLALYSQESYFLRFWLFTWTSLGFALLLPACQRLRIKSALTARIVQHVSLVSYSMYLIHFSFALPLFVVIIPAHYLPPFVAFFLYLLISVAASTVVYRLFEKPATDLRDTLICAHRS